MTMVTSQAPPQASVTTTGFQNDKPDPLLLWPEIVFMTSSTKLSCFTLTLFHQRVLLQWLLSWLLFCCCFLLPGEQDFPWKAPSQNTTLWHLCYQSRSRGQLANLRLKETAHSKTHHQQDPPWNILIQEQHQLKLSQSSEPWDCRRVVPWVNQTGGKQGIGGSSLNFVTATNISAFSWLHSTHEVLKLLIARGWGLPAGKVQ